ncbi:MULTISPECIES: glycosyltransferase family 2 protein [Niastella]|uniref:Glycosyltransferase family 2 protein n=1 Tax=Niastella soli TaxID=2821487 RepID=A0ABS3YXX1_9BACT|nr:glycosyltransferase family 2 protein [Niastella soli]MBO9202771.1 glycosyltransferase family 2 protein [Niastella soli]
MRLDINTVKGEKRLFVGGNLITISSVIINMVSVIIPTYNREHLIQESIYSVLNQTYKDLELIIVDDGSTDNTEDIVRAIPDPRIQYYKLPHSGRNAISKNFAIRRSTGTLIAFNDSDDTWVNTKLEKQVELLAQHPNIGFSITDATNYRTGQIISTRTYAVQQGIEYANIFNRMKENRFVVYNPTILMRRSCLDITGLFDETMPYGAEFHFNILLAFYFDAGIIYEPLLWRLIHGSNDSIQTPVENLEGFMNTFEYLYNNNMVSKKYLNKAKSHAYRQIGHLFKQAGNGNAAHHNYRQSLKYNLLQPICYWLLLKTYRPDQLSPAGN